MPNIHNNLTDDSRLGFALREALEAFETVDVATVYLDLRGWSGFADLIDAKPARNGPVGRVLVAPSDSQQILDSLQGEVQPPAYGADIHDLDKARARRDQLVKHLRNQLMRGLATVDQRILQSVTEVGRSAEISLRSLPEADST